MSAWLKPIQSLSQIYGSDVIYSPRASPNACTWLPHDEFILDSMSGGQIPVAGDMPILCAAGASTPDGLQLLRDVGFDIPQVLFRYSAATDYLRKLKSLYQEKKSIALQHVHSVTELPSEACWVKPETLSFLNNKANLAVLVGSEYIAARRIVMASRLVAELSSHDFPLVVKAVTEESSGGGVDVVICRTSRTMKRAARLFESCERVVIEEFLPIKRNLCLNYSATAEGLINYLGCAEQVSDTQGKYQGNWIDATTIAPPLAIKIGTRVVAAGFALGYYGCVGIDMAVREDGRMAVFDLNFRVNGSTTALLLAESVQRTSGRTVLRFRALRGRGTYRDLLSSAYVAIHKGIFLPLSSYDPDVGGHPKARPRMTGLILGNTREEVKEHERELSTLGLS
ncbi:MAG TPA: ATP-grasp domain-containing protein [Thermodesulfobacteriota bacterium]|nr:ATP-grasp domain-containing protein [Thermodesulfobacteriota bacterium]